MATYAIKSCNNCGIRKPQPEMERVEKSVVSGSSKSKITSGNVLGALAGSKLSQNKIKRNVFANNKRQYTRKRTVWNCFECSGRNDRIRAENARAEKSESSEERKDVNMTGYWIFGLVVVIIWKFDEIKDLLSL